MTDSDGLVFVVPAEKITGKCRYGIARYDSGGETAICRLDVSVAVIQTDDHSVFEMLHVFPFCRNQRRSYFCFKKRFYGC